MEPTSLHGRILSLAFNQVLGKPSAGSVAFVRCLTPEIVEVLATDSSFSPGDWQVWRVANSENTDARTISADRAVEIRESKGDPTLLLVDTALAGAGMDGIYSAAHEVDEAELFSAALKLAANEVTRRLSSRKRKYAERAVKVARGFGKRFSVSLWTEFDFLCQAASQGRDPGAFVYLLGLWPIKESEESMEDSALGLSRIFVDRLLEPLVSGITPSRRIESLRLLHPSTRQVEDLERFLTSAATKPLLKSLSELADKEHLWINALRIEGATETIQGIELVPWRTNTGSITKWSGLTEGEEPIEPPVLMLKPDAERTGDYSKLEIRWRVRPDNLKKGAADYRVVILTDMDEELASREVTHSASREQKCRFTNDDFSMLSGDALISAKVIVSVIGDSAMEAQETDEFVIRFGHPPEREQGGIGKKVRTLSEGLIELDDRESVSALVSSVSLLPVDSKGFIVMRTPTRGRSFRVFRPPLIQEIESQWSDRDGAIGRWQTKVRASGDRAGSVEFVPLDPPVAAPGTLWETFWPRAVSATRRMAERFKDCGGGVGQLYDEGSKFFETVVKEYILAWTALLDSSDPLLALANTVEVKSLSGRTIGLIVLPNHPLRIAWRVAYDNLVLHARFEEGLSPKDVRHEFNALDGAMFPAFLPGLTQGTSFVFADTLGFHAVGMVPDYDKEPKAAVAILARAFGESETADTVPTVGKQSAAILGNEIARYLDCHTTSKLLHIHALRPGDGFTVARSLGRVYDGYRDNSIDEDSDEETHKTAPAFVLELYPSHEQRGVAGRFIAETGEKRRTGTGTLSPDDHWMLESLSLRGGVNLPRLRWARKNNQSPKTPAHLAVAFDTFASHVVTEHKYPMAKTKALYAFGLLAFFERHYSSLPAPLWQSNVSAGLEGEKHPSDRSHTERLSRLYQALQRAVARSLGAEESVPTLRTEISPEKAQSLRELHQLCDWVITLDRNAGIEYFDSPRDNKDIYDGYVIDCVPERQDLGCLQLITSTSNLEEVRNLLDSSLDQMGLSRSRRNAEFLMEHLKALSGRLAIRLTGQKAPTSELIALALSHANCNSSQVSDCWVSLENGFIIPVDDVRDLLPPLLKEQKDEDGRESRPDLIYVFLTKKGLSFRFIEVKYRRHLRTARAPEVLENVRKQVESLRDRWNRWYGEAPSDSFRAIRRAKLARVLRFYADKANRHFLPKEQHEGIITEIDRMIEKGEDYSFGEIERAERGWIFCPEFGAANPLEISPVGWETRIFLFGSGLLPDSDFRQESIALPNLKTELNIETELKTVSSSPLGKDFVQTDQIDGSAISTEVPSLVSSDVDAAAKRYSFDPPAVCLGTDALSGTDVRWSLTTKGNPHLLVAGLPGMGKTTCLLNICQQMVASNIRPIVFSYHQDIDEKLQEIVGGVRFIDFHGLGFNPLEVLDRESRLAYLDVAGALRDIFVAIYPELGDIQGERIRTAIKESFIEAGWDESRGTLSERTEPDFKRFVEILRNEPKPDRGLRTLLARLGELQDYGFFDLSEVRESLWNRNEPTVIRIHTTQNDNLQRAFTSLVFYGLYKDMFRRGIQDHITHAIIFDEAHRAAGLKLIPTMAKESRKYGISLVLASQEAKDFNISLFSTIANYLVLRLTEPDAKALVRNVASSQQERALIDKIKQMERFKALYFCEGKTRPALVNLIPIM